VARYFIFVLRFLGDLVVDKLQFVFRMSIELPLLHLLSEVSSENSVNDAQGSLLAVVENEFDLSVAFLGNRLSNWSLDWSRSRSLRSFNGLGRFGVVGSCCFVVASSILVDHQECSEEIEFVVLSDVVVELLELDDDCSIVLDSRGIHVEFESPE
jgi:hypothetical protein